MQVTLLEDVKSLGLQGMTVEVPDGYALHFLFPQHVAVRHEGAVDDGPKKEVKIDSAEQQLAADVDGLEVIVTGQVEAGKLKKPVSATEIRAALKELGYKIEKKNIKCKPITEPGTYEVPVEFPSGFEAMVTVTVE